MKDKDDQLLELLYESIDIDAEYMDAVKSGDKSKLQMMVKDAANANGYSTEAWHVTADQFDQFDQEKAAMGGTFWFTTSKDKIDSDETGASLDPTKDKVTLHVYLNASKQAGWDEYEKLGLGEIEGRGYDSVKLDDDYIIYNPNQIKSADLVTYHNGNIIPLSKRFNQSTNRIKF